VTRWYFGFFIVAIIFLVGCGQKRSKTATHIPAPPPAISPARPTPDQLRERALFASSSQALQDLLSNSGNSLPDALLNRTRCFVLFTDGGSQGLGTCRTDEYPPRWNRPTVVWAELANKPSGDLLLFVLSARAAEALSSGSLDFSVVSASAGKTYAQVPLMVASELGYDVIAYVNANQHLAGFDPSLLRSVQTRGTTLVPASYRPNDVGSAQYVHWVTSLFNAINPTGIIIHHSARIPVVEAVPKDLREVDSYHAARGFDIECSGREYHVAYHYLIFPNGKIQAGRPERCQGAHARGYNSYIGISLVGDFSSKESSDAPTKPQLKSLLRLTSELQHRYNIPIQRILRHSDVGVTDCPGDRFAFRQFLLGLVNAPAGGK
jgi:hypothetical protein